MVWNITWSNTVWCLFLGKSSCSCREEEGVAWKSLGCKGSVMKTEQNSENLALYVSLFRFPYLFILELRVFHCPHCKCYLSYMCNLCILFYGFLQSTTQITEPCGTVGHQSHFLHSLGRPESFCAQLLLRKMKH